MTNNNGRKNWPMITYTATVIFAAGGAWALLYGQMVCNEKQDARLNEHQKQIQAIDKTTAVILERLDQIVRILEKEK